MTYKWVNSKSRIITAKNFHAHIDAVLLVFLVTHGISKQMANFSWAYRPKVRVISVSAGTSVNSLLEHKTFLDHQCYIMDWINECKWKISEGHYGWSKIREGKEPKKILKETQNSLCVCILLHFSMFLSFNQFSVKQILKALVGEFDQK